MFGFCITHILNTGVLKFEKKSVAKRLNTPASKDASQEDDASLFFHCVRSWFWLRLFLCFVCPVGSWPLLFFASSMVVWPLWLRVVSTSVVVFLYGGSLPRSSKLILHLLENPGWRVLAPLLTPLFTQFNHLCPRKFGVRNTWPGF